MNPMNYNERESEYMKYLSDHIQNVMRSYQKFLRPVIEAEYPEYLAECDLQIRLHDVSKYDDEEFWPYCNYFYPTESCPKDEFAFDTAWLLHQKKNPHHWQYHVLIRDSSDIVPMPMPIPDVVNMLCDWHSFSAKDSKSTASRWYQDNRQSMLLNEDTRDLVDYFLEYLTQPL